MSGHDHTKCCKTMTCAHPLCCGYYGPAWRVAYGYMLDKNAQEQEMADEGWNQ